jgi:hypothetical protein
MPGSPDGSANPPFSGRREKPSFCRRHEAIEKGLPSPTRPLMRQIARRSFPPVFIPAGRQIPRLLVDSGAHETHYDPLLLRSRAPTGAWAPTDSFLLNGDVRFRFDGE